MDKLLAALHLDQPDSLKRALVALFGGVATIALPYVNSKLPTPLSPEQVNTGMEALAGLTATFLLQSGVKAGAVAIANAKAAGDAAGAAVPAPGPAAAVVDAMAGKASP